MRFSLRLNNDLTLRDYVAVAQAAEAAGFNQIWVSNDLFLRSAPVILQTIAQATQRIEVGAGILNPYTIHPAEIAMLAATLDEATGNRFNLGLAAGAGEFLKWVGIEAVQPLTAMRESVSAIRSLLRGERTPMTGSFLHWEQEAYLRFDAPRVTPIYIGAMGPKMLALTGELADGALPLLFPPEHYFGVLPYLQAGAAQRSPALAALDLAVCIWVSLSEDRAAARRVLAAKIAYYGHALSPLILDRLGVTQADFRPIEHAIMVERDITRAVNMVDERMLRIGIVGGAHDVIERLEPLVAAGARHLSFGPPLGPDQLEAVRLLGQVIKYFRR
ncbi:MAG: LLM class flavin-dependent oxidoreductase [Caldilinea sp.]|uniref:LLM class flavin-dependent oxidoreductase n=1 Tax=Caldilinea sp. TaxID=2293560 RepID=UPI002D07A0FE|nr:LLM class flavin-dependent oxidoreductase [Anaerolineales bacterium]HQY91044.1 LLM class flavin-dependent oxidoreductase [Caldilinea sp.]